MHLIYPNGQKSIVVPANQKIAVGVFGEGWAIVRQAVAGDSLPRAFRQIAAFQNGQNTYGTFSTTRDTTISIQSDIDEVEYNVGLTPSLQNYKQGYVGIALTATGVLPIGALNAITPYNSAGAGILSLPDAAIAWKFQPYGLVVVSQVGAGAVSFAASGSDTLRATSGISTNSVQYGMIAAQIISATEWALS